MSTNTPISHCLKGPGSLLSSYLNVHQEEPLHAVDTGEDPNPSNDPLGAWHCAHGVSFHGMADSDVPAHDEETGGQMNRHFHHFHISVQLLMQVWPNVVYACCVKRISSIIHPHGRHEKWKCTERSGHYEDFSLISLSSAHTETINMKTDWICEVFHSLIIFDTFQTGAVIQLFKDRRCGKLSRCHRPTLESCYISGVHC